MKRSELIKVIESVLDNYLEQKTPLGLPEDILYNLEQAGMIHEDILYDTILLNQSHFGNNNEQT